MWRGHTTLRISFVRRTCGDAGKALEAYIEMITFSADDMQKYMEGDAACVMLGSSARCQAERRKALGCKSTQPDLVKTVADDVAWAYLAKDVTVSHDMGNAGIAGAGERSGARSADLNALTVLYLQFWKRCNDSFVLYIVRQVNVSRFVLNKCWPSPQTFVEAWRQ
jgi:hypothetical protein